MGACCKLRKDGSLFPVEVGISSFKHDGQRFFTGFVRDRTERQAHVEQLHWHATRDEETRLINYKGLVERAQESRDGLAGMACVVIQLQWLARCIAAQGRTAGLHIVRTLGDRIQECIDSHCAAGAVLARTGGDTFTLFAKGDVLPTVRRIQLAVNEPIGYAAVSLQVIARIGVSTDAGTLEERYHEGVVASERVDGQCGGVQAYSQELSARLQREFLIEYRLRGAVSGNALRLMLQPKVCLSSGKVFGAEALVRWVDAELGPMSPVEFIPIAERSGQIVAITEWMLHQSLTTIKQYAAQGLSVAVNFSAIDFQQHDMLQRVERALADTQVEASQLGLS
jgi:predicted signal transduction protein with EAL and GGDEF domain